jgi:hypothetical protein
MSEKLNIINNLSQRKPSDKKLIRNLKKNMILLLYRHSTIFNDESLPKRGDSWEWNQIFERDSEMLVDSRDSQPNSSA